MFESISIDKPVTSNDLSAVKQMYYA